MRFSIRTALIWLTSFALVAMAVGVYLRLPDWYRSDVLWFTAAIGGLAAIAGTGATIGWLSATRSSFVPGNLWPGLILSVPNWAFYALVRNTLHMTSKWDRLQLKSGGLEAMERLASMYFFEALAICIQIAIVFLAIGHKKALIAPLAAMIFAFWLLVLCLELWLCAASGVYYGSLR